MGSRVHFIFVPLVGHTYCTNQRSRPLKFSAEKSSLHKLLVRRVELFLENEPSLMPSLHDLFTLARISRSPRREGNQERPAASLEFAPEKSAVPRRFNQQTCYTSGRSYRIVLPANRQKVADVAPGAGFNRGHIGIPSVRPLRLPVWSCLLCYHLHIFCRHRASFGKGAAPSGRPLRETAPAPSRCGSLSRQPETRFRAPLEADYD